jgi:hypothetical protein
MNLFSRSTSSNGASRKKVRIHLEKGTLVSTINEIPSSTSQLRQLEVTLQNGALHFVDYVVNATGVLANLPVFKSTSALETVKIDSDTHGVCVDAEMRALIDSKSKCFTSVYAAGDCCSISIHLWDDDSLHSEVPLWFQMRLWSQARSQGMYVADCVFQHVKDEIRASIREPMVKVSTSTLEVASASSFDVFVHSTRLFQRPCLLIGLYNGQGLGEKYEEALKRSVLYGSSLLTAEVTSFDTNQAQKVVIDTTSDSANEIEVQLRIVPNEQYAKLMLFRGRLVGAILIGDTGLDETVENLITNRLNLRVVQGSDQSINVLDPTVDIEDYFD